MNAVFLDTVGLIALWDETDPWNVPAGQAMRSLGAAGRRLITTSYVLLECANALARTPFRVDVCQFRAELAQHNDRVEPSAADIEAGWAAYWRDSAGGASVVDHVSFIVMNRLAITDGFTNDRHFKSAGFNTLF
jgi:uncharacterized protein